METACYLRMRVMDKPGVLARITRTLADSKISIEAMVQKEPGAGERQVDIVLLTNLALEKNVDRAIARIDTNEAAELLLGVFQHEGQHERAAAVDALKRSRGSVFLEVARGALSTLSDSARQQIREVFHARGEMI